MTKDINRVINKIVELSHSGAVTGTYNNKIVSINFKVEPFDLEISDDKCTLSFITEQHCSPGCVKFKLADIKNATFYEVGEYEKCTCAAVAEIIMIDGSEIIFFDDLR